MKIQDKFEEFHAENPHVYTQIVELAKQWQALGKKKLGMKMLFEVIRWDTAVQTRSQDFKLNNNYTSRYTRLVEDNEPTLAGLFRTRVLTEV